MMPIMVFLLEILKRHSFAFMYLGVRLRYTKRKPSVEADEEKFLAPGGLFSLELDLDCC
jgi:hypothetical protein